MSKSIQRCGTETGDGPINDPAERENPDLLNPSRRRRIAAGSGNSVVEVNRMIKQFKESKNDATNVQRGYEHSRYGSNARWRR